MAHNSILLLASGSQRGSEKRKTLQAEKGQLDRKWHNFTLALIWASHLPPKPGEISQAYGENLVVVFS